MEQPTLDLLIREIAQARGITSIVGLADALGVSWRTANDYWGRTARRIARATLADACRSLSCEPHHLLRVTAEPRPAEEIRDIGDLPQVGLHHDPVRIALMFRPVAEAEFDIHDMSAFARHTGVSYNTAMDIWYDRVKMLDFTTVAKAVQSLGGQEAMRRLVVTRASQRTDVVKTAAGLAVPQ